MKGIKYTKKIYLFIGILGFVILTNSIHPFLAMSKPVQSNILVVEGWLPDSFLRLAVNEFTNNMYETMVIIRGQIPYTLLSNNYSTLNELDSIIIDEFGIEQQQLIILPTESSSANKTYNSYRALNSWIKKSNKKIPAITIFTASVHARKSYLLCRKALDTKIKVGVISAPPLEYNPQYWWLSKRGIRLVSRNTIGFLYALLWIF